MTRPRTFGSIFWVLVLVFVGCLLIVQSLGYSSVAVWHNLSVSWPVLIIVWGFLKIGDYYRLRRVWNSVITNSEVVLLVFILIIGTGFTVAVKLNLIFGLVENSRENLDLLDVLGESED